MIKFMKTNVLFQLIAMMLGTVLLYNGVAHAADHPVPSKNNWASKAYPIRIVGSTADGKYPIYAIDGAATDITYKAGNRLYTSGDLVGKLVFLDPKDAKSKQYNCEFLCKDKQDRTVGINPSFKFLVK